MSDLVKRTGSLQLHYEVNDIIQKVTLMVKEIPEFQSLKFNHDLTLYVLNMVVNMVKSKKIDPKEVALNILSKIFNLNDDEINILSNQIDYLLSTNAVKKISSSILLLEFLKKKFVNT